MRTEFPSRIHEDGVDEVEILINFVEFADSATEEIAEKVVEGAADFSLPDPLVQDFRRGHAHERGLFSELVEALKTANRKHLLEHRLVGKLLTFKTRLIELLWGEAREAVEPTDKDKQPARFLSSFKRVLGPITTLLTSIFQACGLTPPSEFFKTLQHLVGYMSRNETGQAQSST